MEQLTTLSSPALFSSNGLVIIGSLIVIISYLFNLVAKRFSIPSIAMSIALIRYKHRAKLEVGLEAHEVELELTETPPEELIQDRPEELLSDSPNKLDSE